MEVQGDRTITLHDKVTLITGSTSGIGRGIASYFAQLGSRVIISGRNHDRGAMVVEEIQKAGGDVVFLGSELSDIEQCRHLIRFAAEHFGGLDILVNNAANTSRGNIESTPIELWDLVMAVNLRAPFICLQEAIPLFKARGGGSVINIGSVNAYIGEPKLVAYSVSKGGLMTLTRNAASYLNKYQIRVNQLNVGWTLTEGEERVKREEEGRGPEWIEEAIRSRPFGRMLSPQDVAYAAAYFASDESECVTGTVMDLEQHPVGAPPNW
jgi:NAD(P)-dependent dehydrogenase (short-subunit alcohol dehydrogenase family)